MNIEEMRAEFEKIEVFIALSASNVICRAERMYYGWRGYQEGRTASTAKLEAQIARMADELTAANHALADAKSKVVALENSLRDCRSTLSIIDRDHKERGAIISRLNKADPEHANQVLEDANAISRLKFEICELRCKVDGLEDENKSTRNAMPELEDKTVLTASEIILQKILCEHKQIAEQQRRLPELIAARVSELLISMRVDGNDDFSTKEMLAKIAYEGWRKQRIYQGAHPPILPSFESLRDDQKSAWAEAADRVKLEIFLQISKLFG